MKEPDLGDFPTTIDGAIVLPATSPLTKEDFRGRDVVWLLPDEWKVLAIVRALRLGNIGTGNTVSITITT